MIKKFFMLTLAVLFSLGQMWGEEQIYLNEGAAGTASGITATGNVNTNTNNGNPGNSFANTTSSNTTFTFSGFEVSEYTALKLVLDARWASYPSTTDVFPFVKVTAYKNNVEVFSDMTSIAVNSKVSGYNEYTVNITADFDKLVLTSNPSTGKTAKGAASTVYSLYMDNIKVLGTKNEDPVPAPTFDVAAGTYSEAQTVKVSNYDPTLSYYYTLDGSNPTDASTAYVHTNGVSITSSCTLKMIAYKGSGKSNVTSAAYVINKQMVVSSISVQAAPTTTTYTEGDNFDPAGLVITVNYTEGDPENVTYAGNESKFTFAPALDAELATTDNNVTITYGGQTATQTITVNEKPSHNVKFYVNGDQLGETLSVKEGVAVTFPADPADEGSKTFVGWVSSPIVGSTDVKPDFVDKDATKMGGSDITYYAVYATASGEGAKYQLVSDLAENETYIFVSGNSAGTAYALDASAISTTASTTNAAVSVTIAASGSDMYISTINTNLEFVYVETGQFDIVCSTSGEKLTINGSGFSKKTSSFKAYWNSNGLYGTNSGGTKSYYVKYNSTNNNFQATEATTTRVYAFEKKGDVEYSDYCTSVVTRTISSISVETAPTKLEYTEGDNFDPTGLVITVNYAEGDPEDIAYVDHESSFSFAPALTAALATSNTSVTITYAGKSATQAITVNELPSHDAKFFVNGNQLGETQSVKEGLAITFPATKPADIDGKKFQGWAMDEIEGTTETKPEMVASANMEDADMSFYAVYAEENASNSYTLVNDGDEVTTGYYVFDAYTGTKDYAMGTTLSNKAIAGTELTFDVDDPNTVTNPDASLVWYIERSGNTVSLFNEYVSKYLNIIADGNYGQLALEDTKGTYTLTVVDGGTGYSDTFRFKSTTISRQELEFYGADKSWKSYSSADKDVYLLKQNVTISGYCTTVSVSDYTRAIGNYNFGTICLPYAGEISANDGVVKLYEVAYKYRNAANVLAGISLVELEGNAIAAGKAYIFEVEDECPQITVTQSGEKASDPETEVALLGTFVNSTVAANSDHYIINGNEIHEVQTAIEIAANRAYINMNYVAEEDAWKSEHAETPVRFFSIPGVPYHPIVTGVEEASAAKATKALVNGKLVIVRGAKAFNVNGAILK